MNDEEKAPEDMNLHEWVKAVKPLTLASGGPVTKMAKSGTITLDGGMDAELFTKLIMGMGEMSGAKTMTVFHGKKPPPHPDEGVHWFNTSTKITKHFHDGKWSECTSAINCKDEDDIEKMEYGSQDIPKDVLTNIMDNAQVVWQTILEDTAERSKLQKMIEVKTTEINDQTKEFGALNAFLEANLPASVYKMWSECLDKPEPENPF